MSNTGTPSNLKTKSGSKFLLSTPRTSDRTPKPGLSKRVKSSLDVFETSNRSVLNTAFTGNTSITNPLYSKSKSKSSTALDACFTPSSLYKSTGATPKYIRSQTSTPIKTVLTRFQDQRTPECFSKVAAETPVSCKRSTLHKEVGEISNLTVAVRVRPLNTTECRNPNVSNIISVENNEIIVYAGQSADNMASVNHRFQYDHVFWSCHTQHQDYASQSNVFEETASKLLDSAFNGYNACLFAYGQTGSGKSYSMMGIDSDDVISEKSEAGIIPRFCHELFRRISELGECVRAEIEVSYFEIYNEKIHDLLAVSTSTDIHAKKPALRVREHQVYGPYVVDLSTHPVNSYEALKNWFAMGNRQRATAATGMNDKSSRSHSIFNIVLNLVEISDANDCQQAKRSKISLVDLAGSERISHTSATGDRLREGASINKSLLTLGKVIAALADSKKNPSGFVPYRDSVLTRLLKENLGGNSRTLMLATISPASIHLDETLATLRYACQARSIVNRVKVNENESDKTIRELRAQIERLETEQQEVVRQKQRSTQVDSLKQQLLEAQQELLQAEKSWMDRLKEAENKRHMEMDLLKQQGIAFELNKHDHACLVNLIVDPSLSETLYYILPKEKTVNIGRTQAQRSGQHSIILNGPLIGQRHCSVEHKGNKLFITPEDVEFETFVNGKLIHERLQLFNGDRLVIGGNHYFRVSNPKCTRQNVPNESVDFQVAFQEMLKQQESELRQELETEKRNLILQFHQEQISKDIKYKEELAGLELEKFKYQCSKELLESEKKGMKKAVEEDIIYTPSKSTLLDEIQKIFQDPADEHLHKTQLKVKEATQRCKDMGLNIDFKQTQVADGFGLFRSRVFILDRDNCRRADWPPVRLEVWLNIIRESENLTEHNLFDCVDIEWEDQHDADSLNSSRISLNISAFKSAFLNNSPPTATSTSSSIIKSVLKSANTNSGLKPSGATKMLNFDQIDEDDILVESSTLSNPFEVRAHNYLKDIHKATLRLKKMCQKENKENSNDRVDSVLEAVNQIDSIVRDIRFSLQQSKCSDTKSPKSVRFLID